MLLYGTWKYDPSILILCPAKTAWYSAESKVSVLSWIRDVGTLQGVTCCVVMPQTSVPLSKSNINTSITGEHSSIDVISAVIMP